MGSRIAAHMTNAGLPVVLLDIVPAGVDVNAPKQERNKIVLAALDGLKKSKPAAFYSPESARLITIGNFEDDLSLVADCDWIIEVVAENMEIKRALLNKVQQHRRSDSIITSNTSGLPIHEIVDGMPMELRRHWFGTHFFNPPRYMRLLEIIATPDTDPVDMAAVEHFCDLRLGKTIVHAHDTPNFI
jgi:3-hydroxyacyl-CoA dehydrogenase